MGAPQYWAMRAHPSRTLAWAGALALALAGCGGGGGAGTHGGTGGSSGAVDGGAGGSGGAPVVHAVQSHSGSLEISPDGRQLYVVHPDADSVSIVDAASRTVVRQVLLAAAPPAVDASGRYAPSVGPRALAHDSTGTRLYVTGQWSSSALRHRRRLGRGHALGGRLLGADRRAGERR